jgi:hypothetical protein
MMSDWGFHNRKSLKLPVKEAFPPPLQGIKNGNIFSMQGQDIDMGIKLMC